MFGSWCHGSGETSSQIEAVWYKDSKDTSRNKIEIARSEMENLVRGLNIFEQLQCKILLKR